MAYGHQMKITTTNVRPATTEVTKTTNIQTISKEIEATTMSNPYDVANQNDNFDYFVYEEPIPIIPIVNLGPRTVINQESNQEWWKV